MLVVQPGSGHNPVQATLEVASLDSSPEYRTISYAWGDATLRSTIELDKGNIDVPASTVAALIKMRSEDEVSVLWIDAVCINQSDIVERAQQVQMMSQIYSRSRGNLIFLGDGDPLTASALTSIHRVYLELEVETNDFSQLEGTLLGTSTAPLEAPTDIAYEIDIAALKNFFSLPWFK